MNRLLRLIALVMLFPCAAAAEDIPEIWQTVAEKSDFRATSTFAETMDFLRRVESRAPDVIRVTSFGRTAEGRPLPLVIVSSDGAFTPAAAKATGKPILLLQSGIHAGEIDGKDASLMLLRSIALGHRADFATNWRARYMWWYRQTPYWDEQVGLLPIYRVIQGPLPLTDH